MTVKSFITWTPEPVCNLLAFSIPKLWLKGLTFSVKRRLHWKSFGAKVSTIVSPDLSLGDATQIATCMACHPQWQKQAVLDFIKTLMYDTRVIISAHSQKSVSIVYATRGICYAPNCMPPLWAA